jgi:hypothetical protein
MSNDNVSITFSGLDRIRVVSVRHSLSLFSPNLSGGRGIEENHEKSGHFGVPTEIQTDHLEASPSDETVVRNNFVSLHTHSFAICDVCICRFQGTYA